MTTLSDRLKYFATQAQQVVVLRDFCPECGSRDIALLSERAEDMCLTKRTYRCSDCGFIRQVKETLHVFSGGVCVLCGERQ